MKSKYVWFKGRTWRQESDLKDWMGRLHLVDWKDTSKGILAEPHKVRDCSKKDTEAIEHFLSKEY